MTQTSVADTLREYLSLLELLDDAYWEASSIHHKDMLYDIISIFSQEGVKFLLLRVMDPSCPAGIDCLRAQRFLTVLCTTPSVWRVENTWVH